MNSRGDILYTELDEKMIGQNYWNAADSTGKFYVREMIEKAEIDGYAIVEYRFLIEKDGTTEIKRSYVKYIEELDMFIAAGIYQVAIEEQLYSFLENKLKTLNANGSNYIIINDPDRILKLNFLDSNIQFATDFKGLTDQIVSHVNNEMAFTVEHSYFNEMNDEFYYIGSFKYIDNWNIFLGEIVHFNMTELSQNNLLNSVESFSRLTLIILTVLVTLVILVAIIVYDFISKQHEQNLKISLKLIESLYDLSIESVVVTNKQKQILYGNNQANTMFNRVFSSGNYELIDSLIKKLGNENLTVVDRNDVEIIVDIHTEQINLHNEEFYIYFFRDVSDEFKYNKKLEIVAHTDHLTFLPNRRQFDYDFNHIVKSISRTNQSFILVYLDLDHFKNVNDKFGHDIGDKVLVSFASLFHNNSRETDQLYRFGGEEFFMILQETELEVAKEVVKRFNRQLENYEWVQEDLKITFSAGLIVVNGNDLNKEFSYYFKKVDKLLYEAKERGRNLVLTESDL
jgi:diguanylate cyclase (GGDEF)-like protein